jgi:hypothetical protein
LQQKKKAFFFFLFLCCTAAQLWAVVGDVWQIAIWKLRSLGNLTTWKQEESCIQVSQLSINIRSLRIAVVLNACAPAKFHLKRAGLPINKSFKVDGI